MFVHAFKVSTRRDAPHVYSDHKDIPSIDDLMGTEWVADPCGFGRGYSHGARQHLVSASSILPLAFLVCVCIFFLCVKTFV